jgi:glyoxylase-like metal-dependent hydrolase (beta-lactamase superfamily II)
MSNPVTVDVFNSGYKPIPNGGLPGWDPDRQATWPASTSTLIAAGTDAILVDALMTTAEGERLAAWVRDSGRSPSSIYITHGHGDHFFGAGPMLSAFPQARLVSLPGVLDEARQQTNAETMQIWNAWFPGQFDEEPAVPTELASDELKIDGHLVRFLPIGGADGVLATVVHVPDAGLVVSGDVAYNDIHMWLWNSTPESRAGWLASLDALTALTPKTIVTGHKDPDAPDDDARRILDQSRRYIEDFDGAAARSSSAKEIIDAMMERYAGYGNPYTLHLAAATQFGN